MKCVRWVLLMFDAFFSPRTSFLFIIFISSYFHFYYQILFLRAVVWENKPEIIKQTVLELRCSSSMKPVHQETQFQSCRSNWSIWSERHCGVRHESFLWFSWAAALRDMDPSLKLLLWSDPAVTTLRVNVTVLQSLWLNNKSSTL